ncbi:MAG: flagellar type III secretion system pore protein FliP [Planctomycetes bacterium]|nr:flagellar type III secretion system pore protein FliP [Planctomycetota bacterium]
MTRHTLAAVSTIVVAATLLPLGLPGTAEAQGIPALDQRIVRGAESPEDVVTTLEILFLLTVLTLAPSILVMTTAFTRIVIVLSFLRRALATQELPPTQIVIGLALILTFMVMGPTWIEIKDQAIVPYVDGEISQKEAFRRAMVPTRAFMFEHVRREDLRLFVDIEQGALPMETRRLPRGPDDIGTEVLVPAFVISELRKAFEMGFMLYLPFLVIDLVVSTILISMGMLVLPPILISLPFKILLFVLVDGWNLIIGEVVRSFH